MSDALTQESIAGNVEAPVAATPATEVTTPAATPVTPEPAETPLSIDDALAKAIEKHSPPSEKPAKGLLPEIPGSKSATPEGTQGLKPGQVIDPITQRVLDPITPPGSLTPALREKWGSIPREFQDFWAKRERDHQTSMQETAEARKSWKEFTEVVAPYEATLRTHNISAVAHAKELFNLSHLLNTGSREVKADVIARLIHQFQPDPQALAHHLNQRPQAPMQTPPQPVNVRQEMEKVLQEREEAAKQAEGKGAWEAFAANPANEFLGDVQGLMSKILDAELVTGNTYPELFKNAYDLACSQHPEVKTVLAQRAAQTPAATPAATPAVPVAQPRPNGTVKPSLGASKAAPTAPKKLLSLEEAIAAAQAKLSA